ncbi:hypothetical protein Tco_1292839, partial [Tanacetum coccineum]
VTVSYTGDKGSWEGWTNNTLYKAWEVIEIVEDNSNWRFWESSDPRGGVRVDSQIGGVEILGFISYTNGEGGYGGFWNWVDGWIVHTLVVMYIDRSSVDAGALLRSDGGVSDSIEDTVGPDVQWLVSGGAVVQSRQKNTTCNVGGDQGLLALGRRSGVTSHGLSQIGEGDSRCYTEINRLRVGTDLVKVAALVLLADTRANRSTRGIFYKQFLLHVVL